MFTLQQIKDAHSKVRSGADFPGYIRDIKGLGVLSYTSYVSDGHSEFYGTPPYKVTSEAKDEILSISDTANTKALEEALSIHQQGETDYLTFCKQAAAAGVEKWVVDISEMTCTYFDKDDNELVKELIPVSPPKAIIMPPGEGESFSAYGTTLVFKIITSQTNDQFGLYHVKMEPFSNGPKLHFHKEMDETFIIHEGTLTVLTADGETQAKAGTVVYAPRLTAHGYNNNSEEPLRMTMIFNPGQNREDFFRELYKGLEQDPNNISYFQDLYARHDSYPLDETDMIPIKK